MVYFFSFLLRMVNYGGKYVYSFEKSECDGVVTPGWYVRVGGYPWGIFVTIHYCLLIFFGFDKGWVYMIHDTLKKWILPLWGGSLAPPTPPGAICHFYLIHVFLFILTKDDKWWYKICLQLWQMWMWLSCDIGIGVGGGYPWGIFVTGHYCLLIF